VPIRPCIAFIPSEISDGNHCYDVAAASSMEAAWNAMQRHGRPVADHAIITVILGRWNSHAGALRVVGHQKM
jgi:hypothetical protein